MKRDSAIPKQQLLVLLLLLLSWGCYPPRGFYHTERDTTYKNKRYVDADLGPIIPKIINPNPSGFTAWGAQRQAPKPSTPKAR